MAGPGFSAEQRRQYTEQAAATSRLSSLRLVDVVGCFGGLRGADLPDALHELDAVILEDALHAADGIALAVEEMANPTQQVDVVGPVIATAAAALHRPDLRETRLPEPQHVLRQIKLFRHLADGAECVRRFIHRHSTLHRHSTQLDPSGNGLTAAARYRTRH